jgi:hypothetical protein
VTRRGVVFSCGAIGKHAIIRRGINMSQPPDDPYPPRGDPTEPPDLPGWIPHGDRKEVEQAANSKRAPEEESRPADPGED